MYLQERKILIPRGNLKIPRRNMPQIQEAHFGNLFKWLRSKGVRVRRVTKPGIKLKPIQKEIDIRVVEMLSKTNDAKLKKPFLITKDGFILDGHHRWLALLEINKKASIQAFEIGLPVKEALRILRKYPRVTFKDGSNVEYNQPDRNLKLEQNMSMSAREYFITELQEQLKDVNPNIMDSGEYALVVQDIINEIVEPVPEPIEETRGSFKDFVNEARKKKFDPEMRIAVRGFGTVKVKDLEKMVESRMGDVVKFQKKKDWRNVLFTIQNTAIIPLLEKLKEVQDANE